MKSIRWVVLLAAVLAFGRVANADTADPAIGVRGCTGGGCSIVVGPGGTFSDSFTSDGTANEQTFGFINNTGQTAAELDLLITPFSNTGLITFTCLTSGEYFNTCSPETSTADGGGGGPILLALTSSDATSTLIRYFNSGEGSLGGIPNAGGFSCDGDFCTPNNPAADAQLFVTMPDLAAGQGFNYTATLIPAPVPEPATVVLISSGLACLGVLKRRRSKRDSGTNSSL